MPALLQAVDHMGQLPEALAVQLLELLGQLIVDTSTQGPLRPIGRVSALPTTWLVGGKQLHRRVGCVCGPAVLEASQRHCLSRGRRVAAAHRAQAL